MVYKKFKSSPGQALVEFALIITVLLMIIFLIIEASRILWGWITVQNAAREGARYAITGQFDGTGCAVSDLPKFATLCPLVPSTTAYRTASIIDRTHRGLAGLPLNELSGAFEDDNYYLIEVWGVNEFGQLESNFGGIPNNPVVVRAIYRVPIITPFFSPILPSIPVFGQVTMNNESFGQLGGASQGQGVPPPLPAVPTPGVTPSPTPSPTPTVTNTPGASPTATATATTTATTGPDCNVQFEGNAVAGDNFVLVTGDVGTTVTILDLTTGATLGSATLAAFGGHECEGFAVVNLNNLLIAAHVLLARSSDGTIDTTIVLTGTATPTTTPTNTPVLTPSPSKTPTITPTATPSTPFIVLLPNCGSAPTVQFSVIGVNWPTNKSVFLYWNTNQLQSIIPAGHPGAFQQTWQKTVVTNTTYNVVASNGTTSYTAQLKVPCDNATPLPTTTATATSTPAPADLIVVGPPHLVSTPPIIAYKPVTFRVVISNTGGIDISHLFFVDLYFDPTTVITPGTLRIPIEQSVGYMAVSSLNGNASRTLTITSQIGFKNTPPNHAVYSMVDSIEQAVEQVETNNISTPFFINYVTPAATPTPTATPDPSGTDGISGVVRTLIGNWIPQFRADVTLWDGAIIVATTRTDQNGFYQFTGLPVQPYTVTACVTIDNEQHFGQRTGIQPPNPYADIFMLPGVCP